MREPSDSQWLAPSLLKFLHLGAAVFLLWPLFQIQIAFQLPFVQRRGLWTGKRDREVSEVPKGQRFSIMSPSVCVCEGEREEGRRTERARERKTHLKKVRQSPLSSVRGDAAKGIPAPPLTPLSL